MCNTTQVFPENQVSLKCQYLKINMDFVFPTTELLKNNAYWMSTYRWCTCT